MAHQYQSAVVKLVFNLLNHENFGSYVTNESNRNYGQPSFNGNVAYQPRMLQLGFRIGF